MHAKVRRLLPNAHVVSWQHSHNPVINQLGRRRPLLLCGILHDVEGLQCCQLYLCDGQNRFGDVLFTNGIDHFLLW